MERAYQCATRIRHSIIIVLRSIIGCVVPLLYIGPPRFFTWNVGRFVRPYVLISSDNRVLGLSVDIKTYGYANRPLDSLLSQCAVPFYVLPGPRPNIPPPNLISSIPHCGYNLYKKNNDTKVRSGWVHTQKKYDKKN